MSSSRWRLKGGSNPQLTSLQRRRAKARRPAHAATRPGSPAPTMGPGTTTPPNRIWATSANPTVLVNATREISSPPAVVSVKKFCPLPLRGSTKLDKVNRRLASRAAVMAQLWVLLNRLEPFHDPRTPIGEQTRLRIWITALIGAHAPRSPAPITRPARIPRPGGSVLG